MAGKAGGKRKGKAGSKGTEAQAGNRDSGAGGAKGGGEGMGKALGGLAPFAQQFLVSGCPRSPHPLICACTPLV